MGIYERFNVRPLINVAGVVTRCGGALMEQEALEAMNEAAKESVRLDEFQAAASQIIAEITHAEAGIVTCGACAALTLGTAACITGLDVDRMNQLPDTTDMPNRVIMAQHQISGYEHAITAAGAKLVGVGIPSYTIPPGELHVSTIYDFESAITEHTVAIAYAPRPGSNPPLEQVIALGKKYNVPVMLDAAAQVPPVENLHKFIDMGADLVAFSGGKGIRGPQASGILCGRHDLIASAALQSLDMGGAVTFDRWDPPPSLIPKEKLRGKPQLGIGRSMKVSKEAIVSLLTALQLLTEEKSSRDLKQHQLLLEEHIARPLHGVPGVEAKVIWTEYVPGGEPVLEVRLDKSKLGQDAFEVSQRLIEGDPRIYVGEKLLPKDVLTISPVNLNEERARIVADRLQAALVANRS